MQPWRDEWFAGQRAPGVGAAVARRRGAAPRGDDAAGRQPRRPGRARAPARSRASRRCRRPRRACTTCWPRRSATARRTASRFRGGADAGVWYGAKERETACTEVGYWRWRFLMDSEGLRGGELVTEHTFFQAQVRGRGDRPDDASPGRARRRRGRSATTTAPARRWPAPCARRARCSGSATPRCAAPAGRCGAVLAPQALSLPEPHRLETWVCKVTADAGLDAARRGPAHDPDRALSERRPGAQAQASICFWNTSPACSRSAWNLIFGQFSCIARSSPAYSSSTQGASTAS